MGKLISYPRSEKSPNVINTSCTKAAMAPNANLNSNRMEMYRRINPRADMIAMTAFPLNSEPIFGLTVPFPKIKSVLLSGTFSGNAL